MVAQRGVIRSCRKTVNRDFYMRGCDSARPYPDARNEQGACGDSSHDPCNLRRVSDGKLSYDLVAVSRGLCQSMCSAFETEKCSCCRWPLRKGSGISARAGDYLPTFKDSRNVIQKVAKSGKGLIRHLVAGSLEQQSEWWELVLHTVWNQWEIYCRIS